MKGLVRTCCLLLGGLIALQVGAAGNADEISVKLAFLLNFPKFVEWPGPAFSSPDAPFRVCIGGDGPLAVAAASLPPKKWKERDVAIILGKPEGGYIRCHMVYLGMGEITRIKSILAELKNQPVLTVSDSEGFAAVGGMLGLVKKDERLKFEVNQTAARISGLKLSSKLMQLAVKVF